METILDKEKLKQNLPLDYVTNPMKDSILTCSFCGEQIIEFNLKDAVEKEAKIKKVISETINLKLLSSAKDLLQPDKLDVEPTTSLFTYQGVWKTKYGLLKLKETGNRVEGSYQLNKGKIIGAVKDKILTGKWSEKPSYSEPNDAGDVEFRLTKSGKSLNGRWKYGSSGDWKFDWQGKLIER
jgi:hypothetical protein